MTPHRTRSNRLWIVSLFGLCVMATGCQSAGRRLSQAPPESFHDVTIVYDLSGQYRDLPLAEGGKRNLTDLTLVGHESPTVSTDRWTSARLKIEYPHPDGKPDFARATLRLSGHISKPKGPSGEEGRLMTSVPDVFANTQTDLPLTSARDDEVWILDFPRGQLDLLMGDLKGCGFFDSQLRPDPGTRLEVTIDRNRTSKNWTPEPRLDDFVTRVYHEGHLGGFVSRDSGSVADSVAAAGW